VIEAKGSVVLSATASVAEELRPITQKKLVYFGSSHLAVETGPTTGLPEVEQLLNKIQLTPESRQEAFEIVENLFAVSTKQTDELLVYAKTHCFDQPFTEPREILQPLKTA